MQPTQHSRTGRIKKMSTYLRKILTFSFFITCFSCLFIPAVFLIPTGTIGLTELMMTSSDICSQFPVATALHEGMTMSLKLGIFCYFAAALALVLLLIFHLRKLLSSYSSGEIFTEAAVAQAKTSLLIWVSLIALRLFIEFFSYFFVLLHKAGGQADQFWSLLSGSINELVLVGFLLIAVWALEIGSDLKQESELTI